MPRYLRVADVPAILQELKGEKGTPYQLDAWQKRWCEFTDKPEEDAAVLSYRWRIRGYNETLDDFKTWLRDCGDEGYNADSLRNGSVNVDWSLINDNPMQIEVAAWLLWLHTNQATKYAWVDQMCVPQDATTEEKMGHIKDSPAIYTSGKVFVVLAPVVDYTTGRIMTAKEARALVKEYHGDMKEYLDSPGARQAPWRGWVGSPAALSRSAVKALLVNNSYMRRIWTIQEAVAARELNMWPLKGQGELNSFQSLRVMDWPEFNAWNGHPGQGVLSTKWGDEAARDYEEGDYTSMLRTLKEHGQDAIAYLAKASSSLMWVTMDRNSLVNDLRKATDAPRRAFVLLNNNQVHAARSFLPEDRVLALVPLVDYGAWKIAMEGVSGAHLPQASVAWAYSIMETGMATFKWSMRCYNHPRCAARGLEQLRPRRNLTDGSSMHGTMPGESTEIPAAGGTLVLPPPPPPPSDHPAAVGSYLASISAHDAPALQLKVESSLLMPHPGQAKYWGEGPWKFIRDALTTDETFRLAVQWSLEPWREPEALDAEQCAAVVVTGEGLASIILMAVPKGEEQPTTGQLMMVVDFSPHLLQPLLAEMARQSVGTLEAPITAVSAGVVPPPPPPPPAPVPVCEPAPSEPEWQVVNMQQPDAPEPAPEPAQEPEQAQPATSVVVSAEAVAEEPGVGGLADVEPAAAGAAAQPPAQASPAAKAPEPPLPGTVVQEEQEAVPAAAKMQKGTPGSGVPNSGVEVAAGARYAGQAPVAQTDEGPCKGCALS